MRHKLQIIGDDIFFDGFKIGSLLDVPPGVAEDFRQMVKRLQQGRY